MSTLIFAFAASRDSNAHPLAEAARVALEANPIPRMIRMSVDHDGTPIEIPGDEPLQIEMSPREAQED